MPVVAAIASSIVILEFVLSALGMLLHMEAQLKQFADVTGYQLSRAMTLTIGILHAAGVAGVVAGFWRPGWAVVAGSYFTVYTGVLLALQLRRGNSGMLLATGVLFFAAALLVLVTRGIQVVRT